jgi:hypothetical protein
VIFAIKFIDKTSISTIKNKATIGAKINPKRNINIKLFFRLPQPRKIPVRTDAKMYAISNIMLV